MFLTDAKTASIEEWGKRKVTLQLALLDAAVTTIVAMETWCKAQSSQFLSSWKVQQFLLVSQGDLKILTDYALRVLKICSMLVAEIKSTAGPVDSLQLDKANRQKIRVGKPHFSSSLLPSEPNQYAELAINTLLKPVTEGVCHLKATSQITVVSIATTKMLDTWMNFILKEKPKFSLHGACQLEQDLNHVHAWLASDVCGLKPDSKQSILALDAVRNFHAAVHLLKFQPPGKLGVGLSSSKDELTSEYSVSTAPSDSHKDGTGTFSDPATYTPPIQRAKGTQLAGRNSDPGRLANQCESGSEEDLVQLPRKKEWLSLRVHQGNRWKLSFNCLNNNQEDA
ncbi:hypothetical protein BSL78_10714 [Apostichopus japonicus]|uniref:Coiled-coil protein 142 C-terminal domain-containing protein n=1 Tax=Stichopus japonicus TaxID=307972 RepID=A0A2G8KWQ7_STIJA|nr:hypothetical protein BSL78_10714 [Apostichopus japonicus]